MQKIKNVFDYYFNLICFCLLIFLLTGVFVLIFEEYKPTKQTKDISIVKENSKEVAALDTKEIESKNIKVDIKGAVKKPGVYEISSDSNVFDLIKLAGGITKNADTSNLNLSKIITDQSVIKVYTKSELKKLNNNTTNNIATECNCDDYNIDECNKTSASVILNDPTPNESTLDIDTPSDEKSGLISINNATKEQLMTLSSIGEAKATAIIEYRTKNGKFTEINQIKNVSGIGDALFEKIKDFISL